MLSAGARLGRYEIDRFLGAGGMGEVYRARDLQLERPVALKTLFGHLGSDAERRDRLTWEGRAASALNHPNILTVYETGEADGRFFLATELVEGHTVRQLLLDGPLALLELLEIASQVAAALAAAEKAGLVHGDLKPENVMVRPDGWVKVLDFGLARFVGERSREGPREGDSESSEAGRLKGTVPYMAPEMLREKPIDARTDVWGLGLVIWEMVTGKALFTRSTTVESMLAVLGDPIPPLSAATSRPVPAELERIVGRSVAREAADRYTTAASLHQDLAALAARLARSDAAAVEATTATQLAAGGDPDATVHLPFPSGSGELRLAAVPLVGRERELERLAAMLRAGSSPVTVTGPGGVGKTVLARAAMAELATELRDGAFFVALEAVTDPVLVASEVARALSLQPAGGIAPAAAVRDFVRRRRLLLVLDNFEQVLAAAGFVAELRVAAPELLLLVTSREPLRVAGESELPLAPLEVPPAGRSDTADLQAAAAVRLFVERARKAVPDLELDSATLQAVGAICRRLDGLPLGIELAAARMKLLSAQAILERLDASLDLLVGGPRDRPDRQRTMRGAVAWGYELLGEEEKALFRRLSVFRGGASLEGASAVAAVGLELDVLEGLASLLDKSFLLRDERRGGEVRFRALNVLRDFGLEELERHGEREATQERHARWVLELARTAAQGLRGSDQDAWLSRLEREHDDVRAVLAWLHDRGRYEEALELAASLWWFWYLRGHYREGRRWLDSLLVAGIQATPEVRARALLGAGALAFLQCDYAAAADELAASAEAARTGGDATIHAAALQYQGSVARERGDLEAALGFHAAALELWRKADDRREIARSLNYLAFASWLAGDLAAAAGHAEETLPLFRALRDVEGLAWALLNLGAVAYHGGELERARTVCEESLRLSRDAGYREGEAWSLEILGRAALRQGDVASAAEALHRALALHTDLGDRWRTASVVEALAAVDGQAGRWARAAQLLGIAEAIREAAGTPVPAIEGRDLERVVGGARGALGPATLEAFRRAGHVMPADAALLLAAEGG